MISAAHAHRPHWRVDFFGALAVVALTIVCYYGGVRRWMHHRADNARLTEQIVNQQQIVAQHQAMLDHLTRQLIESKPGRQGDPVQLTTADTLNQRVADLNLVMQELSLFVDRVEPGRPTPLAWFDAVELRLAGKGEYPMLGAFFGQLRKRFPDITLADMKLIAPPSGAGPVGAFDLTLIWYTRPSQSPGTPRPELVERPVPGTLLSPQAISSAATLTNPQ